MGQGKLGEVILRGTRAAQPLATDVADGTLYYVTDETVLERSNATAWQSFSASVVTGGITQLTGDVTAGPGSGSVAATIANDAVTDAKLRESGALSVIGRSANSTGNPADIAASAASDAVLRESGSTLGFGTVAAGGLASNSVTTAKIADDNVTYAKIQNVSAASRLLGRGSASGAGDVEELTISTGLTLTGTVLTSSGAAQRAVFCLMSAVAAGHDPADASTYVWGVQAFTNPNISGTATVFGVIQPRNGTVTRAYGTFVVAGTLGTAGQNGTVRVRNSTASTSEIVSSAVPFNAVANSFNNTGMTLAFSAGDMLEISLLTPSWTTNPTDVFYNVTIEVEYS